MSSSFQPVEAMGCARCPLYAGRTNVVWGEGRGDPTGYGTPLLLLGEAPGFYEDRSGRPFVGKSGKYLDTLLVRAGISRKEDVYITNRVKCRPPQNRDPRPREKEACLDWLELEMKTVRPEVVVLLGRHAASWIFPGSKTLRSLQGVVRAIDNTLYIATYHPAAALRQGEGVGDIIVADLKRANKLCVGVVGSGHYITNNDKAKEEENE